MINEQHAAWAETRRFEIQALIARYPELSPDELEDAIFWFKHEATALDVGLLASEPRFAERYRSFRRDHIDRLRAGDALIAAGAVGAVAALAGAVVYLAA